MLSLFADRETKEEDPLGSRGKSSGPNSSRGAPSSPSSSGAGGGLGVGREWRLQGQYVREELHLNTIIWPGGSPRSVLDTLNIIKHKWNVFPSLYDADEDVIKHIMKVLP